MMSGSKIIAPDGFLSLKKGVTYYFLISNAQRNIVRLIEFIYEGRRPQARLLTFKQFEFEEALENGWIFEEGPPASLPPWLSDIEGKSVASLESERVSKKVSYEEYINNLFKCISELVLRKDEILAADRPNEEINKEANRQQPKQNTTRLQLWFYTYLMFGHNRWALLPAMKGRSGTWDRDTPERTKKVGRPPSGGSRHGYHCNKEMKAKILRGFLKYKDPSKTQYEIYSEVLKKVFGCDARKLGPKSYDFSHPDGNPFPSFDQFIHWVRKQIDTKSLNVALKGTHGAREISGSVGSYADKLMNIYQRVEFDGYNFNEKLRGLTEGSAVDGFCTVRGTCGLTGYIVAIGFSEGSENMAAYLMALFSMAIGKVRFCELFGLKIDKDEWIGEGLCSGIVLDRGPAATIESGPQVKWLKAVELTPTYSGQSKATVESSHPRKKKNKGKPVYSLSNKNFVEMAKREVVRAIKDNHRSGKNDLDEELVLAGVDPTPHGAFSYYHGRGRNSAVGMNFETAVRTFLSKHPAVIRKDAVYLYGRKYRSSELVETGVFDRVARYGVIDTYVYVLTMCVRHIWLDVKGVLYQLDVIRTVRTPTGLHDITLADLQEVDRLRQKSYSDFRRQIPARDQYFKDMYEDAAEVEWFAGKEIPGRPPKGAAYQRDTDDYNRFRGAKK